MPVLRPQAALRTFALRRTYATARPGNPTISYVKRPTVLGLPIETIKSYGTLAAGFGGVAGLFAIFFFAEIPRVARDVTSKIPIIGGMFLNEVAPEDNPF